MTDYTERYGWVAEMFREIPGVEVILLQATPSPHGDEVSLCMTNNRTGKARRTFEFPLKTNFFVDYSTAPDCPHNYDVANFDGAENIVALGVSKARKLFGSVK